MVKKRSALLPEKYFDNLNGTKVRPTLLTKKYFDKLNNTFDILDIIKFTEFDTDFSVLENRLTAIKKDHYLPNERIIIEHFDTDFYHHRLVYGLNLYNLIETIRKIDIPFFTIMLITNHFGIKKEIDKILKNHNKEDFITVIETFITNTHYTNSIDEFDIAVDKISFSAMAMLGASRSHRVALYHFLDSNNLLDKVEVSLRGSKEKNDFNNGK